MRYDYLIVGQGLSGSLLAVRLLDKGCSVLVVDTIDDTSPTRTAGGIINPVTGKRMVTTWMADELIPFAPDTYQKLSTRWNIKLIEEYPILDFYPTLDAKQIFDERVKERNIYLRNVDNENYLQPYFSFNYGVGEIAPCYIVNLNLLLAACREELTRNNALLNERFHLAHLQVQTDQIIYNEISAGKIIFCDGPACMINPYFESLPWSKDKGEALIASIPDLPRSAIYKQYISITPWEDDLFWIGASHDWKYTDPGPTEIFRKKTEEQLNYWLKLPYTIVDHTASLRPANIERRPFVGLHPQHNSIGILNGMGGKGCSWAPYFAAQFAAHLVDDAALLPSVDITRFRRILTR